MAGWSRRPETVVVVLVACSDPTPEALTPTSIPVPTAAATAASSKVSEPAKTPTPEGKLVSLRLRDSKALQSALSDTELACIGDGPEELARALTGPGPASQEEQAKLIVCLNDETPARIFLTGFVLGSEPLSEITSDSFRAAFEVIDSRKVMTTGIDGDPGRAMAESMTTLSVTMACLDDEEWDAAASKTGLRPDERACAQGVQRQFLSWLRRGKIPAHR